MKETAQEVLEYFQENLLATLVIALIAGFSASKTVAHGKKGNFALYLIIGLLGSFLGQYAILYFGLKEILDQLADFRLLFDLIAAYLGSFVLASLVHFVRPT
ncbi:MAG: GlsB/YeaQ/YmgE family stress response membrane protein [Deltaproteobacteria bacterium]|nr:GlsB/YeaQ/YmgE family stress response membrane protein [Deltaproteobacteria bacterium]